MSKTHHEYKYHINKITFHKNLFTYFDYFVYVYVHAKNVLNRYISFIA